MPNILSYTPGQRVALIQQVLNIDGYRQDGYSFTYSGPLGAPVIARIILPNFTLSDGYPVAMTKLDTGLYVYAFTLPAGAHAVGTYIVDIYWYHPTTHQLQQDFIQLTVTAPYGIYSATVPTIGTS